MSAIDIFAKLDGLSAKDMDPLQRILLITDGTITEILEATFLERIQLIKLSEQLIPAASPYVELGLSQGETLMERKILLQGSESERNYAYAESVIAVDRLEPSFRDQLIHSNVPLGRLWLQFRLETIKELLEVRRRDAGDLSGHFGCASASQLLARTYRVSSGGRTLMAITENFPIGYSWPSKSIAEIFDRNLALAQKSRG